MRLELYEIVKGQDILKIEENYKDPLVDGIVYPQQYILIVAEEKMGKTILVQQLACCMTSGTAFLDTFNIPKPLKVWYIPTEGRVNDLKDRFIRIGKFVPLDVNNLTMIPIYFRFNTKEGLKSIDDIITKMGDDKPDVVIIDALYRAVSGSLKDDDTINEFNHIIGLLQKELGCAVILVHHMTKPTKNQDGKIMERTDKDSFGSAFLPAAVDHIFWIERYKNDMDNKDNMKKDRYFRCDTQRSGKIVDGLRLRLIEPEPLGFKLVTSLEDFTKRIKNCLTNKPEGLTIEDLVKVTNISRSNIYINIKLMLENKTISKTNTRPVKYVISQSS